MKVNNINGTSGSNCKCGDWLKHWQRFGGLSYTHCAVQDCHEMAVVGAHVQRDDMLDKDWYIAPFCKRHNSATRQSLELEEYGILVPANVSATCGK